MGDTIIGHERATNFKMHQDETPFMYSSTDLLNWTPLGAQASVNQMWRPKYAKPNGQFWVCLYPLIQLLDRLRLDFCITMPKFDLS